MVKVRMLSIDDDYVFVTDVENVLLYKTYKNAVANLLSRGMRIVRGNYMYHQSIINGKLEDTVVGYVEFMRPDGNMDSLHIYVESDGNFAYGRPFLPMKPKEYKIYGFC